MPSSHHRDSVSKAEVLPSSRSISPAPVSRQSPASQADLSLNSKDEVGGRLHAGPAAQQTKVVVRRSGGIGDGFLALAEPELLGAESALAEGTGCQQRLASARGMLFAALGAVCFVVVVLFIPG